jgi:hypothetical protein
MNIGIRIFNISAYSGAKIIKTRLEMTSKYFFLTMWLYEIYSVNLSDEYLCSLTVHFSMPVF